MFDWLFGKYEIIDDDVRKNLRTGQIQGYSDELGKWCDLDYLEGTNYDDGYWILYRFRKYRPI